MPDPTDTRSGRPLPDDAAEFVVRLGAALVASGAPVDYVERTLDDVATQYGIDFGYSVLPTGLIALGRDGTSTVASIAGSDPATYHFDQITDLFELLDDVLAGKIPPATGLERLHAIDTMSERFAFPVILAGHVLLTVGLALLLEPTWPTLAVVAVLGALVAVVKRLAAGRITLVRLLPAFAAFGVSAFVFALRYHGVEVDGLKLLLPPLVTFLPGAMLTVGAVELTNGSIVAGSSRLVAGTVQVALLALGVVAAAGLIDQPPAQSLLDGPGPYVGSWAPWLGVALFGLGAAIYFSAATRSYGPLLVVLYAAYIGQVSAAPIVGDYASGFIGAFIAMIVASVLNRRFHGPPVLVAFLPAFWLLVPGVLSVVGVTRLAVGDAGIEDAATAIFTILAVALGVVAGLGASQAIVARSPRKRPDGPIA
jgi:uncharacterized membrane protein YjjP (DUF1212 family)